MRSVLAAGFLLLSSTSVLAQRAAFIAPDESAASVGFTEVLSARMSEQIVVLDDSLVRSAYSASKPEAPFNMTRDEARRLAAAIGSDAVVLVRSSSLRRSSSQRPEYYESNAFIYVVSGRTGRLLMWRQLRYEASTQVSAAEQLSAAASELADEIRTALAAGRRREIAEPMQPAIEEVPLTTEPRERFRAPVPYRRIKPEYTADAAYYDIKATVEITVDLSAEGKVLRTEIERWAGFGLDESVERTVRAMNWRPAERNGKQIPMCFLLRYNFADIRNDER